MLLMTKPIAFVQKFTTQFTTYRRFNYKLTTIKSVRTAEQNNCQTA